MFTWESVTPIFSVQKCHKAVTQDAKNPSRNFVLCYSFVVYFYTTTVLCIHFANQNFFKLFCTNFPFVLKSWETFLYCCLETCLEKVLFFRQRCKKYLQNSSMLVQGWRIWQRQPLQSQTSSHAKVGPKAGIRHKDEHHRTIFLCPLSNNKLWSWGALWRSPRYGALHKWRNIHLARLQLLPNRPVDCPTYCMRAFFCTVGQ